jgi:glucose-1-phosphate cytidylyltransferase
MVHTFYKKRFEDIGWINGSFYVCQPKVFDYIKDGEENYIGKRSA